MVRSQAITEGPGASIVSLVTGGERSIVSYGWLLVTGGERNIVIRGVMDFSY
jgi:hypothetical protein